jgi:glutamate synthase (NADPH/NADH) small chain
MGKPTGFIEWQRVLPKKRSVTERLGDFKEFYQTSDPAETKRQGGRCMDCGVPFCQQGCPLGNQIPDWNDLVYRDRWLDAHKRLASTNNFPEFTGRLCPAPCEGACVLAINGPAVTEGWVRAEPPRQRIDKSVAIVGSGPAGLAAAVQLSRAGYRVVVFEAAARPGGLLRYGIPDFKMEKWVIDRRLTLMEAEGVEFRCGVEVGVAGKGPSWDQLRAEHDAVLIAIGARVARDLEVPGRELGGVVMAMDFLTEQNEVIAGERASTQWDVRGKNVVILGGGDTGSDCLGTSLRQGAAHVTQIELMPAPPAARAADNPWPQWPMIFRTSTSQDEGGERAFAIKTTRIEGKEGRIVALHTVQLQGPADRAPAHPGELREVPGSEKVIPVDTLILAMGFTGPDAAPLAQQLGVQLDKRGNVAVDRAYQTSVPGVYAAGDAKRGASLIVWAIAEGREAARSIDAYLRGADSWLPTRGIDQPFGGR